MEIKRKIEIEEVTGAWVITENKKSQFYSQSSKLKDHIRLIKDLLETLELQNTVDIKER